jgi:hypothetical protein
MFQNKFEKNKKDFYQPNVYYTRMILPRIKDYYINKEDIQTATIKNDKESKTNSNTNEYNLIRNSSNLHNSIALLSTKELFPSKNNNINNNQIYLNTEESGLVGNVNNTDNFPIKERTNNKIYNNNHLGNNIILSNKKITNINSKNLESETNYEAITSIRTQETKDNNKSRIKPIPLNIKSLISDSNYIPSGSGFTNNDDYNNNTNVIEMVT